MTAPTDAAATVRDVTMRFRGHTALDGVSTVIERDSITGLLGRHGAGKTTLMQLLTGHRVPTSGRVEVNSVSICPLALGPVKTLFTNSGSVT